MFLYITLISLFLFIQALCAIIKGNHLIFCKLHWLVVRKWYLLSLNLIMNGLVLVIGISRLIIPCLKLVLCIFVLPQPSYLLTLPVLSFILREGSRRNLRSHEFIIISLESEGSVFILKIS